MKRNKKGFTLVELVIVIAVIAILAGVMIAVFSGVVRRANENAELQQIKNDELKQKAEDVLVKLDNANWFSWEDFENSLAEKMTQVYKDNANRTTGLTEEQLNAAIADSVKKALDEYVQKNATSETVITEAQIKAIIENAFAEAKLGGVTEEQVRTIVNTAVNGINTVSKADIQRIVDAATSKGLTAAQVAEVIGNSKLAKKDDTDALSAKVDDALAAINGLSSLTKQDVEDAIIELVPVTYTVHDEAKYYEMLSRLHSFSTIIIAEDFVYAAENTNKELKITNVVGDKTLTIKGIALEKLTVNAPKATIYLVSDAKTVEITSTNDHSFHVVGKVSVKLTINSGRVVLEKGAEVKYLKAAPSLNATVTVQLEEDSKIIDTLETEYQDHGFDEGRRDYIIIENNGKVNITNLTVTQALAASKTTTTNVTIKNGNGATGTTSEKITASEDVPDDVKFAIDVEIDDTAYFVDTDNKLANHNSSQYVFRIGATGYNTLAEVNSAITSSCTVYMLKDYVQQGGIEFLQGKTNLTIVMDLGGHTLAPTSWFDIHNAGGSFTIKNGAFEGNARIYLEVANVHLILENIVYDRTDNSSNKFIMFTKGLGTVEAINCTIIGDNTGDEYFLGNFQGGETIIIENTTVNWNQPTWIQEKANYDANKPSYIEFRGTSAVNYSDVNIDFTANYESAIIGDSAVRYTLIASRDTWVQHCASEFESFDDVNNTITIATAAQLGLLAKNVNEGTTYEGYTISLMADINLSDYDWVPIGYFDETSRSFKGTFDGQNHSITGLKNVTKLTHRGVGLFGQVYAPAVIKNLSVSGTIKSNQMYTGGIVGHGYAHIINCSFSGDVSGVMQVGGICGSGGFTITDCTYTGNVSGNCWVGGITGNCQDGGAYTNCTVNGNITALYVGNISGGVGTGVGYAGAGGIAGLVIYKNQVFDNCTFTGTIKEAGITVDSKLVGGYNQ